MLNRSHIVVAGWIWYSGVGADQRAGTHVQKLTQTHLQNLNLKFLGMNRWPYIPSVKLNFLVFHNLAHYVNRFIYIVKYSIIYFSVHHNQQIKVLFFQIIDVMKEAVFVTCSHMMKEMLKCCKSSLELLTQNSDDNAQKRKSYIGVMSMYSLKVALITFFLTLLFIRAIFLQCSSVQSSPLCLLLFSKPSLHKPSSQWYQTLGNLSKALVLLHHGENSKHLTASFVFKHVHQQSVWLAGRLSRYEEAEQRLAKVWPWEDTANLQSYKTGFAHKRKKKKSEENRETKPREGTRENSATLSVHTCALCEYSVHIQFLFYNTMLF